MKNEKSRIIDSLAEPCSLRKNLKSDDIETGFEFGNCKFILNRKIGNGSYGDIWLGRNKGNLSAN